jgi:hypothetical protein
MVIVSNFRACVLYDAVINKQQEEKDTQHSNNRSVEADRHIDKEEKDPYNIRKTGVTNDAPRRRSQSPPFKASINRRRSR